MNEVEAIHKLKEGDISGLEILMQKHYLHALRTTYLITRDLASAEDIVNSAFLRVYERADQFREGKPFRPWFLHSVVNDALMLLRRRAREVIASETEVWEELVESSLSAEPALDDLLIAQETNETIWEALGKLTATQRTAIVMRYYLGMSESEMSCLLEHPPGTVKSRLNAARRRLRDLLPIWLAPSTTPSDRE